MPVITDPWPVTTLEEHVASLAAAMRDGSDNLLEALCNVLGDEDSARLWASRLPEIERELHVHAEDEPDDGKWFCRCGEFVRPIERDDFEDDDRDR
jgi:thiamine monophosphate kinase